MKGGIEIEVCWFDDDVIDFGERADTPNAPMKKR